MTSFSKLYSLALSSAINRYFQMQCFSQ